MANQTELFDDREELLSDVEKHKTKIIDRQQVWNADLLTYLKEKYKNRQAVYFSGNTASSKNSKEISQTATKLTVCCNAEIEKHADKKWYCTKCGLQAQRKFNTFLRNSDLVLEYKQHAKYEVNTQTHIFLKMIEGIKPPYKLGFYFIRESRNSWDYNNVSQILCDIIKHEYPRNAPMVKHWMEDDSMLYLEPYPLGFHHNKEKPGAIITLMDDWLFDYKKTH